MTQVQALASVTLGKSLNMPDLVSLSTKTGIVALVTSLRSCEAGMISSFKRVSPSLSEFKIQDRGCDTECQHCLGLLWALCSSVASKATLQNKEGLQNLS